MAAPRSSHPRRDARFYIGLLLLAAALLAVPLFASSYVTVFLIEGLALVALAYSWNLISGYTGYFTLGHIAFFGLGGYATAMLLQAQLVPWTVAILIGGVLAVLAAGLIGPIILRLRSIAFAIAAFGFARILESIAYTSPWFGGGSGIYLPPPGSQYTILAVLVALVALSVLLTRWFDNSVFGLRLLAIREDQDAAQAMGVPTQRLKLWAFMTSAFVPGVVGGVFTYHLAYIDPVNAFLPIRELTYVAGVLLGGYGTVAGPFIGMALLLVVYEFFWASAPWLYQIIMGALIMLTVVFMPRGLIMAGIKRGLPLRGRGVFRRLGNAERNRESAEHTEEEVALAHG